MTDSRFSLLTAVLLILALASAGCPQPRDGDDDDDTSDDDDDDGMLYRMSGEGLYNFYAIDPLTAVETEVTITNTGIRDEAMAMSFDPNTGLIYFVDWIRSLHTIDATGTADLVGTIRSYPNPLKGLSWSP